MEETINLDKYYCELIRDKEYFVRMNCGHVCCDDCYLKLEKCYYRCEIKTFILFKNEN